MSGKNLAVTMALLKAEFGSDAEIFERLGLRGNSFGISLVDPNDTGRSLENPSYDPCENYRDCTYHGRTEQGLSGCSPQDCPRHIVSLGVQK